MTQGICLSRGVIREAAKIEAREFYERRAAEEWLKALDEFATFLE